MSGTTTLMPSQRVLRAICLAAFVLLIILTSTFGQKASLVERSFRSGVEGNNLISSNATKRSPGTGSGHVSPGGRPNFGSPAIGQWKTITAKEAGEFADKGERLLHWISMSAQQATTAINHYHLEQLKAKDKESYVQVASQSRFTSVGDVINNGWEDKTAAEGWNTPSFDWTTVAPVGEALDEFQVSEQVTVLGKPHPKDQENAGSDDEMEDVGPQGPNFAVNYIHSKDTEGQDQEGKQVYYATGARYSAVYNPKDRLIIATWSQSPIDRLKTSDSAVVKDHPDAKPPPLSFWSDVAYLEYAERARSERVEVQRLRYVFQARVNNLWTRPLAMYLLQRLGSNIRDFPGWNNRVTWSMESEAGQALLGSPNGASIAWMLIQHKRTLGQKRIKSVTVWLDKWQRATEPVSSEHLPNMIFELEDVQTEATTAKSEKPKANTGAGVSKPQKKPPRGSGGASRGSGTWTGKLSTGQEYASGP